MRESERVEILRNLLTAQGFLSIADLMAATGVSDPETRVTEAA
jgi:DeoR/GlpR family transcriptional regulator of sugar metabolism